MAEHRHAYTLRTSSHRRVLDKLRVLEWDIVVHINDVTRSSQKSKDEGEDSLEMKDYV
jgi:hypothetical protein